MDEGLIIPESIRQDFSLTGMLGKQAHKHPSRHI